MELIQSVQYDGCPCCLDGLYVVGTWHTDAAGANCIAHEMKIWIFIRDCSLWIWCCEFWKHKNQFQSIVKDGVFSVDATTGWTHEHNTLHSRYWVNCDQNTSLVAQFQQKIRVVKIVFVIITIGYWMDYCQQNYFCPQFCQSNNNKI